LSHASAPGGCWFFTVDLLERRNALRLLRPTRSIYGVASPKDAKALHDEGIAFSPLPVLPDERN